MYTHTIIAVLRSDTVAEFYHLVSSFPAKDVTASKLAVSKELKRICREYPDRLSHVVVMINDNWATYTAAAAKKLGNA